MSARWLGLCFALVILGSGCSTHQTKTDVVATLRLANAESKVSRFFPSPPEVPRLYFSGDLVGESNFSLPDEAQGRWQGFLAWLTGARDVRSPLELFRPQAVATDQKGRIFVSDAGRLSVMVFDVVKGEAREFKQAAPGENFKSPSGLAVTPDGTVYVADAELAVVVPLDLDGAPYAALGANILKRPAGVAYDVQQDRLLVADTAAHDVKVFDRAGNLLATFGAPGEGVGEFNRPTHLAVWRNELYVADTFNARIQVLDLDSGQPKRIIGQRGTYLGQLVRPKGVSVDNDGNVYVVESYHDHLLIFDHEGRFLLPIGGTGYGESAFYLPAGLWFDDRGRLYLADMYNGRVATYVYLGSAAESQE